MAYVEWHDTVRNHFKTDALMLALDVKRREAVGIIGCLSSWAIQYRPGGIIERGLVKVAVEWEGDGEKLVKALIESGWLDISEDPKKVAVHDWKDITSGYRKARADAARKRREYRESLHGDSTEGSESLHGDSTESRARRAPRGTNGTNGTERAERSGEEEGSGADAPPAPSSPVQELKEFFGPEDEVQRQLLRAAQTAKCPNNPDTIRRHNTAWTARVGGERVLQIWMDPWTPGKTVVEIQDHFFPKEPPGKRSKEESIRKFHERERRFEEERRREEEAKRLRKG